MEEHEKITGRKNPYKRLEELPNGLVGSSQYDEACKALSWDCINILRSAFKPTSTSDGSGNG